jgi:hypothetical protein
MSTVANAQNSVNSPKTMPTGTCIHQASSISPIFANGGSLSCSGIIMFILIQR